jgi:hypothetical protein
MKTMVLRNIFFLIGIYMLITSGCRQISLPPKDYVKFRIADVIVTAKPNNTPNASNSYNQYEKGINLFEFSIGYSKNYPFKPHTFVLSEPVEYNEKSNKLELPLLDKERYYVYAVDKTWDGLTEETVQHDDEQFTVYSFDLYKYSVTRFINKTGKDINRIHDFGGAENFSYIDGYPEHNNILSKTSTSNDIVLNYNFNQTTVFPVTIEFTGKSEYKFGYANMSTTSVLHNFNAEWEYLTWPYDFEKDADGNSFNIVFMAEAYTEKNIRYFKSYIYNNLLPPMENDDILRKQWNITNVFKMDTLSFENEPNRINHDNNILRVFNYPGSQYGDFNRIRKIIQTSFVGGPLYIKSEVKNNEINYITNIDVIIIVKQDGRNSSYSTLTPLIGKKNDRPVPVIVVPVNNFYHTNHLVPMMHTTMPWLFD